MKKKSSVVVVLVFAALLGAGIFISCGKKSASAKQNAPQNSTAVNVSYNEAGGFVNPGNFFTPIFTALFPEEMRQARRAAAGTAGGGSVTISGGLRQLEKYDTKYYTNASDRERFVAAVALSEGKGDSASEEELAEPFSVVDWGPRQAIPSQVKNPSFYVLFSEPVVPIAALGKPSATSPYMSVSPAIKGEFRWYGTRLLSFEASEGANPLETYTIEVAGNVESINKKKLTGERKFQTTAAELQIIWQQAGFEYAKKTYNYFSQDDVPPEAAKEIRLQFNYAVKADEIAKLATVTLEGKNGAAAKKIAFTTRQDMIDTVTLLLTENIPPETTVRVSVAQPNGQGRATEISYSTIRKFRLRYNYAGSTSGKRTNPVYISFSHPVDEQSVLAALKTTPEMKITSENIDVDGNQVSLFGLPVTFNSEYTIEIAGSLKDKYGRSLGEKAYIEITVPNAESNARFLNYGSKILEAQFPHRMVFEHQNILDNSFYTLTSTNTPLFDGNYKDTFKIEDVPAKNRTALSVSPQNERIFNLVELDPYLQNGRGAVRFDAKIKMPKKPTEWDTRTSYEVSNTTTVQVTDLGVTVRYGINKVVALVTKLSDGSAVKNAKLFLYSYATTDTEEAKKSDVFAVTDSNGLAVMDLDAEYAYNFFRDAESSVAILVVTDDDQVTFVPESHYPWRSGIYNTWDATPQNALKQKDRIFMFSDRYLYKPGETVSFRGIDRKQSLGVFLPYEGEFKVALRENWGNKDLAVAEGKTSVNGGFYGSFALPEDLEPGTYELAYTRDGGKTIMRREKINIAFFERVRFQTGIAMPKTPVFAGEKIQASLSASYLAGGVLSQAQYTNSWFREPWYFAPNSVEFKEYKFGPVNSNDSRSYIGQTKGVLDANGNAIVSCDTTPDSLIKGVPYRYRISADVVDLSNQSVSTANTVVVHPASYYIGVSKPLGITGFAKVGDNISFDYVVALPNETLLSGQTNSARTLNLLAGNSANLSVKFSREEWNLVQQKGIGGNVYTKYEKSDVTESEQSVKLAANGKITVTASKPGYHTLTLSASDASGRDVITQYSFFVTGSGSILWNQDDAGEIRLTPDQSQYNPGDTAKILMESTLPKGDYLITVEREGIFTEEVRHFDGGIQVLDVPIAQNYVPVVYVSVSSYSVRSGKPNNEYGVPDLDKPKGFYGAATVFVNPHVKAFSVQVETPKPSYKPGEEVEITLTATKGGAPLANAELTLLAVDRGVLDLVNYHVPDPISFFYDTENFPLYVKGGDSRAYLMDPVTYEIKNLLGGDSDADKMNERSDFNPTAVFEPALVTDERGKITHKFKLPDTLTTYRITVFGVNGELLALQEDEILVQNPINVQQVLPRRMRERDTSEIGVLISNLDGSEHEISVTVEMQSPDEAAIAKENGVRKNAGAAKIDGTETHKIKLASGENGVVYFDAVALKAGVVNAVFTVKSDVLSERLIAPLTIEKPYLFETFTTTGSVAGKTANASEKLVVPGFAADGQGDIAITLDATRLGLLNESVRYVFDYPYGCMEQQSARILPLVIFQKYIDVFGLDSKIDDPQSLVKSYFATWKNVQHRDGGFGYWANSYDSNLYVSTRIAHIAAVALKNGYTQSDIAFNIPSLLGYIKENLRLAKTGDYGKAYIYYVLSLMGENVNDAELRQIYDGDNPSIATLALVGMAAHTQRISLQDRAAEQTAKLCADKIRSFMRPTTRGVDITSTSVSSMYNQFYEPKTENFALVLQFFTLVNPKDEMNDRLIFELMQAQRSGYWTNTATTARVFEALNAVIEENNLEAVDLTAMAQLEGTTFVRGSFKGAAAKPVIAKKSFAEKEIASLPKDKELSLSFTKNGEGELYYTTSLRYSLPEEMQRARDEGLGVFMSLYDNETGEEVKAKEGSTVVELESGKVYRVAVKLSSSRDRTYVALRAPIPSGAEILDATFATTSEAIGAAERSGASYKDFYYADEYDGYYDGSGFAFRTKNNMADEYDGYYYGTRNWMSNQMIYDNEVQFFWDRFMRGETTAEFKFRAARKGVFPTPSVNAECMYEPEIFGRTEGLLYTIK